MTTLRNMSEDVTTLPPAGWYGDPQDAAALRYWDGSQWTDQTRPMITEQAPAEVGAQPAAYSGPPILIVTTNDIPGYRITNVHRRGLRGHGAGAQRVLQHGRQLPDHVRRRGQGVHQPSCSRAARRPSTDSRPKPPGSARTRWWPCATTPVRSPT